MSIRKIILPVLILFGIIMLSCNKEKPETRLSGIWRFEEVTYRKNFTTHKTDLTDIYRDIRLHFFDDKTFLYHHAGRKIDLTGYWEMDEDTQSNGETTTTITYLDWSAEDGNGNFEEAKWDNISFNKKGMKATESKYGGSYRFQLVRE